MRIFAVTGFERWQRKEKISNGQLKAAIDEIGSGLTDAELGGGLVKKRIARTGGGKRAGYRTIVALKYGEKAVFLYGFAKNERSNIGKRELTALKRLGQEILGYSDSQIRTALNKGALIEVGSNGA